MASSTHTFTYNHPIATQITESTKSGRKRTRQFTIESIGVYPLNTITTNATQGNRYDIPHQYIATTNESNRTVRVSINYADDNGNPFAPALRNVLTPRPEIFSSSPGTPSSLWKVSLPSSPTNRHTYSLRDSEYSE